MDQVLTAFQRLTQNFAQPKPQPKRVTYSPQPLQQIQPLPFRPMQPVQNAPTAQPFVTPSRTLSEVRQRGRLKPSRFGEVLGPQLR